MPTKNDIIAFAQAIADATDNAQTMIGFGAPGRHIKNVAGTIKPTGQVWDESGVTGPWPLLCDAISQVFGIRVAVSGNYSQKKSDGIIGVKSIPQGGLQVTLLSAQTFGSSRTVCIKDESGTASVESPISVTVQGGGSIDNSSQHLITVPYGGATMYSNGEKWFIQI